MKNREAIEAENHRAYFGSPAGALIALLVLIAVGIISLSLTSFSQSPKPLSKESIETLLKGGVSAHRIVTLANELHVDFQLSPELEQEFRALGANDEVLEALRNSYANPALTAPVPVAKEPATPADLAIGHYRQGEAYFAGSKWDDAIKEYRQAIKLKSDAAEVHSALGFGLEKTGDLDGAIAEYREAVRLKPNYSSVHADLAAALLKKGDLAGALMECRQALQLTPGSYEAHKTLGAALSAMGEVDGAIRECRDVVRLAPSDAESYDNLGIALGKKNDRQGAVRAIQKAVQLKPNWLDAHLALAKAFQADGSDIFALAEYLEVLRLRPGDGLASTRAGTILGGEGCWKEAAEQFQRAVVSEPNQASVHAALGLALFKTGDLRGSLQQYEIATQQDAKNKDFKESLKKVSKELKKHTRVSPSSQSSESSACNSKSLSR